MALTKTKTLDKIEIVGEYKTLQARYLIVIEEDGTKISEAYNRSSFTPDTTITDLPSELQPYATAAWTSEVIAAYNEHIAE